MKLKKTNEEWRAELGDAAFQVAREGGTERAFTGEYWDTKINGVYRCRCCGEELFASDSKFDSGSGWPSFTSPRSKNAISEIADSSHGMVRTEVVCSSCDAHLGHLFPDGPKDEGGLRYCINSCSLKLEPSQ